MKTYRIIYRKMLSVDTLSEEIKAENETEARREFRKHHYNNIVDVQEVK